MEIPALDASLPEDFQGKVRLFPLPNLVMYPSVVQALHIFEPRYCDLLREALSSDGLIAMALLKSGWELNYLGNPPISDVVCIGKIISHAPTEDDRHNILLAGIRRARLVCEEPSSSSFRRGVVDLLDDFYPKEESLNRDAFRDELLGLLKFTVGGGLARDSLEQLFSKHVPLGVIVDIISFTSKLPITIKQQMLEQTNVDIRCRTLIRHMKTQVDEKSVTPETTTDESVNERRPFLPPFSDN